MLFGLLPPLAALALRRQRKLCAVLGDDQVPECSVVPSFVPGGDAALVAIAAAALALLGTNTMLVLGFLGSAVKTATAAGARLPLLP